MVLNILIGLVIILLYLIYGEIRDITDNVRDICSSVLSTQLENIKEKALKKDKGDE